MTNAETRRPHAKPPKSSETKEMICRRFKAAAEAFTDSQANLARLLDISPSQVNGYYKLKNYPDEAVLVRFCELTGCTFDWIFRGAAESRMPTEMLIHIAMKDPSLIQQEKKDGLAERALAEAGRRALQGS